MDTQVTVRRTDDRLVVRLTGHVDAAIQRDLDAARSAAAGAAASAVDVDLREVQFFSSVGITFLLLLAEDAGTTGDRIRLIGPPPLVREVLVLTEVHDRFEWVAGPGGDP
jgi:anti-anti-sigma factor